MKYAVIDTESNGLFDFAKPADAEGQPRLAHLCIVTTQDNFKTTQTTDVYVQPDGWEMTPEATAVNGLTTEFLRANGKPVSWALALYSGLIQHGYVILAYNAQFDTKVMRGELRRAGMPDLFEQTPYVCLMRAATPVCAIPKANGKGVKFPKLSEACGFFGIIQAKQHTATDDARSAAAIAACLLAIGKLPAPEVHYAKNRPTA